MSPGVIGSPAASRRRGLPIAATLIVALAVAALAAAETASFRGRFLAEVLDALRQRGLRIVYSSAVVTAQMRVTVEPAANQPRAILDEILPPLGLRAQDGPDGTVLVVRAAAGTLQGRVISTTRGTAVAGATITILDTGVTAASRPDGAFSLEDVPGGAHQVRVEATGFIPRTASVEIRPSRTKDLVVGLEPLPNFVEEVVVTPGRVALLQQEQSSLLSVSDDDVLLAPSFAGDVSRIVESLPGVAAQDNSAAFNVRGSLAEDVSIILDGLELYEPFHLRQFQSPFSHLDTEIVDRVDFLGGAFTADYGDRHGGVVQISTQSPVPGHTVLSAGNINSHLAHAGSLPGGNSWRASLRGWYPEAFRETIEIGEPGLEPRFGDAYLNGTFVVSPTTVFSAHGLFAYDEFDFDQEGEEQTIDASSESGHFWLRGLHTWGPVTSSESVLSAGWIERARAGISDPEDELLVVEDDRRTRFLGLRHDMTWRLTDHNRFKAGIDVRYLDAEYRYRSGPEDDPASIETLRPEPTGTSYGLYVADRMAMTDDLAMEFGVRWDRQTYVGEGQVSPRINALWRLGERSELRFGVGQYFQSQRIYELRIEDRETDFRPAERSRQAGVTFTHRFAREIRFRIDAYYRSLDRLRPRYENLFTPIELYPETEPDRVLIDADKARLKGVELMLQAAPGARFYWRASYALSSAEDVIDGEGVARSWDQTHAGSFLVGYRLGESWFFSLAGLAHTGWPTTPLRDDVTVAPPDEPELEDILGPRNSDRFPPYLRFDVKASRSFALRQATLRFEVEVINVTDRQNACCIDDVEAEVLPSGAVDVQSQYGYWLGITPLFRMIWQF